MKADVYLKEAFLRKSLWAIPFSLVWTALITNAFNLIDVMDGLSTSVALWVSFSFFVLACIAHNYELALLLGALMGALAAFLWYNKPPARIYLGDAGSLFLGGILSGVPFFFQWGIYVQQGILVPLIIFAIPLLEVALLIIIRSYKGIPFYKASPDHFSLYLLRHGWSKWHILGYIHVLSSFLLTGALLFLYRIISLEFFLLSGVLFILVWLAFLFNKKPWAIIKNSYPF